MIKKSLSLCIFLFLAVTVQAQKTSTQYLFDEANQLLQEGKVVQALQQYQEITEQDRVSGALFINMGYSYLQLSKLGKAKYFFLKAKKFEQTHHKALAGLNYINDQLRHQSAVLPALPWQKALSWLKIALGSVLILGIGLLLINAGIFVIIGSWFKKNIPAFIPKMAISLAAIGVLIVCLSFYVKYRQQRYSTAVMVNRTALVMKKPAVDSAALNKAYEGYSFTVDHQKTQGHKKWVFIIMKNGSKGWIQREEIMIL